MQTFDPSSSDDFLFLSFSPSFFLFLFFLAFLFFFSSSSYSSFCYPNIPGVIFSKRSNFHDRIFPRRATPTRWLSFNYVKRQEDRRERDSNRTIFRISSRRWCSLYDTVIWYNSIERWIIRVGLDNTLMLFRVTPSYAPTDDSVEPTLPMKIIETIVRDKGDNDCSRVLAHREMTHIDNGNLLTERRTRCYTWDNSLAVR